MLSLLTNVDLEATHVLAVEVVSGILGVAIVVIFNEGKGALFENKRG